MTEYTLARTTEIQPCPMDLSASSLFEAMKQAGAMIRERGDRYRLLIHVTDTTHAMSCCYLIFGKHWTDHVELCVRAEFARDEWAFDGDTGRIHSAGA